MRAMMIPAIAAAMTLSSLPVSAQATKQGGGGASEPPNSLTYAEEAAGWRLLFDGRSTTGWRGYGLDTMPTGWAVVSGALTRVGETRDIITRDEFGDFELSLQWRIARGGNSGIMYRVHESGNPSYFSGPEMQVLDDARNADGKDPLTSAGSDYALYAAPRGVVRPAGKWNDVRIVVKGNHVEHWLNGKKVVEYELQSPDWKARVAKSKFSAWPEYGQFARGHIALQEHGARVQYRSIKIRELK